MYPPGGTYPPHPDPNRPSSGPPSGQFSVPMPTNQFPHPPPYPPPPGAPSGPSAYGQPMQPMQPMPSSYPPQPYAQPYNPAMYHPHQQQQHQPFAPQPISQPQGPGMDQGFGIPMNPLNLMAAATGTGFFGNGQAWGSQYVQKMQARVGSFTGGSMNFYFAINTSYVLSKLLMLLAPYLKRWTYTRQEEQIQGGHKYRPPRIDVNCPDLYIPTLALWTYCLLVGVVRAGHAKFTPDVMYATVWTGLMAWCVHVVVAKVLLRAMNLPKEVTVAWLELLAYTGYTFVPVCVSIAAGQLGGPWAYYGAWLYGSLCMAIFLVRAMKRIIFQEARQYNSGRDLIFTNYLLLALATFQFPFAFYMGVRP